MFSLTVSAGTGFRVVIPALGPYTTMGAARWAAGAVRAWLHAGRVDGWLAAHPRQTAVGVLGLFWDILDVGEDPRQAEVEVTPTEGGASDRDLRAGGEPVARVPSQCYWSATGLPHLTAEVVG
jgi:hypothetical protein